MRTAPKIRPSNRGSRVRNARRQASKSMSMCGRWGLARPMSRGFRTSLRLFAGLYTGPLNEVTFESRLKSFSRRRKACMNFWRILSMGSVLSRLSNTVLLALPRAENRARTGYYRSIGYSEEITASLKDPKVPVVVRLAQTRGPPGPAVLQLVQRADAQRQPRTAVIDFVRPKTRSSTILLSGKSSRS